MLLFYFLPAGKNLWIPVASHHVQMKAAKFFLELYYYRVQRKTWLKIEVMPRSSSNKLNSNTVMNGYRKSFKIQTQPCNSNRARVHFPLIPITIFRKTPTSSRENKAENLFYSKSHFMNCFHRYFVLFIKRGLNFPENFDGCNIAIETVKAGRWEIIILESRPYVCIATFGSCIQRHLLSPLRLQSIVYFVPLSAIAFPTSFCLRGQRFVLFNEEVLQKNYTVEQN